MKKIEMKSIIVLVTIALVVALLLAGVNMITKPFIEAEENRIKLESVKIVMPDGEFDVDPDELRPDAPETVKSVYTEKNGLGYVVMLVTTKGYTGKEIGITVSILSDGTIGKMVITKNEESIIPQGLEPMGSYGDKYAGTSSSELMELETGATVKFTEGAIKDAIMDAFTYLDLSEEPAPEELYASDEELLNIAKELASSESLTDVTPAERDKTLKRLYAVEKGGYVAYLRTYAQYGGAPETETFVSFDKNGKITAIKNLYWRVGHSVEEGAPTEEAVKSFFDGYLNKTETNGVELVTGATGTANNFKAALDNAISAVAELGSVENIALEISGVEQLKDVTPENADAYVQNVFYDENTNTFVVYTKTFAQYGGGLETEGYIVIKDGEITKISLYSWTVGHTVEAGAPTADKLSAFENSFVGKTLDNIDGVELVTGATGTASNFRNAVKAALNEVDALSEELSFVDVTPSNKDSLITKVLYNGKTGAYLVYTKTIAQYGGGIETEGRLTVKDGEIVEFSLYTWVVGHTTEQGAPTEAAVKSFADSFVGKSLANVEGVELVTGATGTASNVRASVKAALSAVSELDKEASYEDVTPENVDGLVKKVLYDREGGAYIVYTVTIAQYGGGIETEARIVIKNGTITEMSLYTWVVGHTTEQGAPTADAVKAFANSFVGKSLANVEDVELVTGATGTAGNVRGAVKAAFDTVSSIDAEIAFEDVTPQNADKLVKKVLFNSADSSYIVSINTIAQYGGGIETEGRLVIKNGEIVEFSLYTWVVGHTTEQGAPTEAAVKSFADSFVGKSLANVEGVELVTGATGTASNVRASVKAALTAVATADEEAACEIITSDDPFIVKALYNKDTNTYIIYTKTIAQYGGGIETESRVVIKNGKITDLSLYTWVVGHTTEQGAPTADAVKAFADSFIGKTRSGAGAVELVTGATGTATNVRDSILAAFGVADNGGFEISAAAVGYVALTLMLLSIAAVIVKEKIILKARGKKNEK